MIIGINSNTYLAEQSHSNKLSAYQDEPKVTASATNNIDTRASTIASLNLSTPDELAAQVDSLIDRKPSLAAINLNEIMNSDNEADVVGRIKRLNGDIAQEIAYVMEKEQALISQGRAEGQSDKDILMSIVAMRDDQSELYKMSTLWGREGLSSPNNYDKLAELTPSFVDAYA